MDKRNEPWYLHAGLIVVIVALVILLINVAVIEPNEVVKMEKYYKTESRLRMDNIRQAEILWEDRYGKYSDNLDSLVTFISSDSMILKMMTEIDTLTNRPKNPFKNLTSGVFTPESLFLSPKTFQPYMLSVDTSVSYDTVLDRRGRFRSVDTTTVIGTRYLIEDPDGYGKIGDLYSDALKNTASWE